MDVLGQSRRNAKAAKRFFRKLLKGLRSVPRVIVTDKLGSYGAAKRAVLPGMEHRQSQYLNNLAEISHQPTRRRERRVQRFKSAGQAQRFRWPMGGKHMDTALHGRMGSRHRTGSGFTFSRPNREHHAARASSAIMLRSGLNPSGSRLASALQR